MSNLITVVGCGALGSHYIQSSRNFDVDFRVIDFDKVEQKNVMSQFHARNSVGKNKALAAQQLMNFMYGKKINIIPHRLVESSKTE